jgi:hypothetical protein
MPMRKNVCTRQLYGVLLAGVLFVAMALCGVLPARADEPATPSLQKDKPEQSVPSFVPGSWTLAILPDTQNYATYYPGLLELQMRWIVDNKDKHTIAYTLQLGDLTNGNHTFEWQRVDTAFKLLDAAAMPYAIVPGNHDYGDGSAKDRTTKINNYFPPKRFEKWPTFGGAMDANHIESNYHLFKANGQKWIIVGLEWGPRDIALEWADTILHKYSDRKAIIFTHAYLYDINSARYDWAKKGNKQDWNPHAYGTAGGVNDAEEIWQKLVKKHANVCMVISGHVCHGGHGLGFQVSTGDHGNRVNEMAVDYQGLDVGGGAWLRLLEFLPDGKTVQAKTYSPLYDKYDMGPDNQFTFTIQ